MTLSLGTAYRSFGGEVEASSTPTICRLPDSRRHQLWAIALPFLKTLFADSGYQGPKFAKALAKVLPHLDVEIVKRSDQVSGFVVLPKRWIVERTIAWLNRGRRLAKDW